jgi:hypothetical protein
MAGAVVALAAVLVGPREAPAAIRTWDGGATTNLASNPTNWDGDATAPVSGDTVVFNGTSTKDVHWDLNIQVGSWTQEVAYTGTATIFTVYGAAGFTNLTITGDCVLNGGAWTHRSNNTTQTYRLRASVGGSLTVGAGVKITATGRGYRNAQGPAGSGGVYQKSGASHGGQGGRMDTSGGMTYGEATDPVTIGAAGNVGGANDGHGGGAVHITVTAAVTNNGTIDANAYPSTSSASAGAGGSVCLRANSLAGSGTLQANGDKQGGGGRVAVILANSTSLGSVTLQAYGGPGDTPGNFNGAAGTVYKEVQGQSPGTGTLIIDNTNRSPAHFGAPWFNYASTLMPTASTWNAAVNLGNFAEIIVTNKGILGVNRDTTLNWAAAPLRFAGVSNSYVAVVDTNSITFPSTMVVSNYTLLVDTGLVVNGTWIVRTNGVITCSAVETRTQPPLTLTINGNLTVDTGAVISVEGQGFRNNSGPGVGLWSPNRGGSYGGQGGVNSWLPGQTYGSFLAPTNMGSGGVSGGNNQADGGGALRLTVSGTCTVNGVLSANAKPGYAGAGGSIRLTAGSLAGSGAITASGATLASGGGGRIAVVLTNGVSFDGVAMRAFGGTHATTPGAAGTVFRHRGDQLADEGDVIVNNNSVTTTTNMMTHLPPTTNAFSDYLAAVGFTITNKARVSVTTNVSIGDLNMDSTSFLYLNGQTVTVNRAEHALAGTVTTNGGAVIWLPLTLSIADAPGVVEDANGTSTSVVFTVSLSRSSGSAVTFDYATTNGSAAAPDDFLATSGTVTIAAGQLSTNLRVTVNGDDLVEPNETFTLAITNAAGGGVTLGTAVGSTTITNDDARTISIGDCPVLEGNAPSTTAAVFTVTLSQAIGTDVSFQYDTVDGTATAGGNDYVAVAGGTGVIKAGQTQTNIIVTVNGDSSSEGVYETFDVVLSNPSGNATLGASTGTCQIVDDDNLPALMVDSPSVAEGDSGTTTAAFTVSLTVPVASDVTFLYATADGTATAGSDYAAASGGGVIPAGQSQTTVVVQVQGDPWNENSETFRLVLSQPTNATLLTATGTCTIVNDDHPFVWARTGTNSMAGVTNNWQWNGLPATRLPSSTDAILLDGTSCSDLTWNASASGLTATVLSWTQTSNYTGTATVATIYGASGFTNFTISGDCTINGGAWIHPSNSSAQTYRLRMSVGGALTVGSGAKITATGRGYKDGQGPAGAVGVYQKNGASHGGQGGRIDASGGMTYGEATDPVTIGAGGPVGNPNDGHGGGAVYITITGAATNNGTIDANACPSTAQASAGAGGSVCLRASSLTGSGTIQANGDKQGGGGRVAVILANSTSLGAIALQAYGGLGDQNGNFAGAAGTVYREVQGQSPGGGTLLIDNNNRNSPYFGVPYFSYASTLMPTASVWNAAVNLGNFAEVIVTNKGILGLNRDTALNWSTASLRFAGVSNSYVAVVNTNGVTFPTTMVVSNFTLLADANLVVSGTWVVTSNGAVACSAVDDRSQPPFTLTVNGDLTVEAGATISVEGMGYRNNAGPGVGQWIPNRGGSYGGQGGVASWLPGQTYGSYLAPTNMGSGGNSGGSNLADGGGAMRLIVSGTCTVNGVLNANAKPGYQGAGGSIWLTAGALSGSGIITASGATGSSGGGGRIAVILANSTSFGSVALRAFGGSGGTPGAAGTVYLQHAAQAAGYGTLIVDNNNVVTTTNMVTHLPPSSGGIAGEIEHVGVTVTNGARLTLTANQTVGDIWLSSANSILDLNLKTLQVRSFRHALGSGVVMNEGKIVWLVYGSIYSIR